MSGLVNSTNRKNHKPVLIATVLLVLVGLGAVAVLNSEDNKYHLETANNILRRWSCPPGGYPSGPGQRGNCLCTKCPPGHKCTGGHSPKRPCGPGTFQDLSGQNDCKPAPPGSYVGGNGAKKPTPCPYGKFNNKPRQRACTPAPPGSSVPGRGAKQPTPCPKGQYQNQAGQRVCKPARRGTYVNKRGAVNPSPCHYGKYQDQTGQTSCKQTPPGTYSNTKGQSNPNSCAANTYQHCSGQMNCVPCPAGTKSGRGSRSCSTHICGNKNLSLKKPAYQSSTGPWNGTPNKPVGGTYSSNYNHGTCSATHHEASPYFYVDMKGVKDVCKATILNRADCCPGRLHNFVIFVTNRRPTGRGVQFRARPNEICYHMKGTFTGRRTFPCKKRGRYVGVALLSKNPGSLLTLCEFTVIGQ